MTIDNVSASHPIVKHDLGGSDLELSEYNAVAPATYVPSAANANVRQLVQAGTSVWLDDLSRDRLVSGNLADLISWSGVVGVTTNPAIFSKAMTSGTSYDEQLAHLRAQGVSASDAVFTMAIDDVRDACDALMDLYETSGGQDGRVSIEVDPRYAHDPEKTVQQAQDLWDRVGKPNAMIKIPATKQGLSAITDSLARGISVNVTLIFSVERYKEVIVAFIDGLERARSEGRDLSAIHSVASFFVSRVDGAVDIKLAEIIADPSTDFDLLKGMAGIHNAQLAYEAFQLAFGLRGPDGASSESDNLCTVAERWRHLAEAGAHVQRPLWASTSVKNSDYTPTLYTTELAGPLTVNTMPESTLEALQSDGGVHGDALTGRGDVARAYFHKLESLGINFADVVNVLEDDGVAKFVESWNELIANIDSRLAS